ncbi:MAG: hypothetical protein AAGA70_01195 [Pseudomonadota bacterium]
MSPANPHDLEDPKGLIREAYRIDGIAEPECRSIFMDWALSSRADDPKALIADLLARYGADQPDHPMSKVLREGLNSAPKARRRGGRAARLAGKA